MVKGGGGNDQTVPVEEKKSMLRLFFFLGSFLAAVGEQDVHTAKRV